MQDISNRKIAVIGLGYVGLPLVVEFGKHMRTIGFDIAKNKVLACQRGTDPSRELTDEEVQAATHAVYTDDPQMLAEADVIIVTSCLTRDMTSSVGLYRANAIRVLVNIIDSAMLGSIERYIKQAIVDNDTRVRNAALVAASHLFSQSLTKQH